MIEECTKDHSVTRKGCIDLRNLKECLAEQGGI